MRDPEQPDSMRIEHQELQEDLTAAAAAGGKTADAAKAVMKVLLPHILLEEEFAIPPLKYLPALARGEFDPEMKRILTKTETLKAALPRMLDEHKLIVEALRKLLQAAMSEQHARYVRFAQKLILHAQTEEEILYPASIMVGEYIKLRLGLA